MEDVVFVHNVLRPFMGPLRWWNAQKGLLTLERSAVEGRLRVLRDTNQIASVELKGKKLFLQLSGGSCYKLDPTRSHPRRCATWVTPDGESEVWHRLLYRSCASCDASSAQQWRSLDQRLSAILKAIYVRDSYSIPIVNPWGSDSGGLLEALSICGVVFLPIGTRQEPLGCLKELQTTCSQWLDVGQKVFACPWKYKRMPCVVNRHLRISDREHLQRTLEGQSQEHVPDNRCTISICDSAFRSRREEWNELWPLVHAYEVTKDAIAVMVQKELASVCRGETDHQTLGAKLAAGTEMWGATSFRHCIYPKGGSCSEHTDYGVATFQQCTCNGLEFFAHGKWREIEAPEGMAVLFAGDMMERLTNGYIKAVLHRVRLPPSNWSTASGLRDQPVVERQSNILFLQPSTKTVVKPLAPFLAGNASDMQAIRYGEWHFKKASLAYDLGGPNRKNQRF
eukprot:TRINITY_DN12971_c0_g1_i2.p1 TRINITY_DN12971_c0_g1~~TRINITY_DN12971_c0_g1_i2.p1  ORF type:complete len:463 (+),score=36.80 TRINITY_DN12971_c0_g1_i2:34-1389(+)